MRRHSIFRQIILNKSHKLANHIPKCTLSSPHSHSFNVTKFLIFHAPIYSSIQSYSVTSVRQKFLANAFTGWLRAGVNAVFKSKHDSVSQHAAYSETLCIPGKERLPGIKGLIRRRKRGSMRRTPAPRIHGAKSVFTPAES